MKNKKVLLLFVLLLVLAFLLKGVFFAALVNGSPISRLEIIKNLEKRGGKQTLDSLISKELILQEARRKNVKVTKADVDKKVKEIEKDVTSQGQSLTQVLTFQGMSLEDLRDQLEVQAILEKLLADKVKVSDKEVDEFIKKSSPETTAMDLSPTPQPPSKDEVRKQLKQQKLQTESNKLVEDLRKKAKINYFVKY